MFVYLLEIFQGELIHRVNNSHISHHKVHDRAPGGSTSVLLSGYGNLCFGLLGFHQPFVDGSRSDLKIQPDFLLTIDKVRWHRLTILEKGLEILAKLQYQPSWSYSSKNSPNLFHIKCTHIRTKQNCQTFLSTGSMQNRRIQE